MVVLVTGNYETDYNRTLVLLDGLRKNGVDVIEYPYKKINREVRKNIEQLCEKANIIFLPSFTYRNIKEVKRIATIPVVYDPLISMYMTKLYDQKSVLPYTPRALKNYWKDYSGFHSADLLFADTQEHKNYFSKTFKVAPEKIYVLPVGVNTEEFYPIEHAENAIFTIGFYGSFVPLQGVSTILEAAKLLEDYDIQWEIVGKGYEFESVHKKYINMELRKVSMPGFVEYTKLNEAINSFDISLGIFGNSIKANSVVPNKIYHYASCGQPIITKETPAIREVFTHNQNIYLVKNTPQSIADAILELKNDLELRNKLGDNARKLMVEKYNTIKIGKAFLKATSKIVE